MSVTTCLTLKMTSSPVTCLANKQRNTQQTSDKIHVTDLGHTKKQQLGKMRTPHKAKDK